MMHHFIDHEIYSTGSKKLTIAMNRKLNAKRTKIRQRFPQKIYKSPPVKNPLVSIHGSQTSLEAR
jgi:hypothetical protein